MNDSDPMIMETASGLLQVDGSAGEGGGQVLRSSLSLAAATGRAFRIDGIRAGRKKPGLMRQHLTALKAAQAICGAEVQGAEIGSTQVEFHPGELRGGEFEFAVGTAGSTTLVLQTILPPLLLAPEPSVIRIAGGTHNMAAPPFDFLKHSFLPQLERMGARVEARLLRSGFYPAGGGKIEVQVAPVRDGSPLDLFERGQARKHHAVATVSRLPQRIADRELHAVAEVLGWTGDQLDILRVDDSPGPGNVLHLMLCFEAVTEVITGFGKRGLSAEELARQTAQCAQRYLAATAPVGEHLTDQLLLPMALLAGGHFRCVQPSAHTRTNIAVIEGFLGSCIQTERLAEDDWSLNVRGQRGSGSGF